MYQRWAGVDPLYTCQSSSTWSNAFGSILHLVVDALISSMRGKFDGLTVVRTNFRTDLDRVTSADEDERRGRQIAEKLLVGSSVCN
jgi:hypothetical protein